MSAQTTMTKRDAMTSTTPVDSSAGSPTGARERVYPTFLGIGSMRCGSTWLYQALKRRPDVHMSTPKQLQYFNKFMLTKDLSWFCGHFAAEDGSPAAPVRGEITPFYSRLSETSVANVRRLLPDVQIVLTIRNPVERVWSHILYDWGVCKKKNLARTSTLSLMNFLQRQRTIRYTDYETVLRRWRRHYGDAAVHVDLFDRIKADSTGFLRDVLVHIGADPDASPEPEETLKKPVLAAQDLLNRKLEAPAPIRWALAAQWLPTTRRLNEYLDGRVSHWIDDMEAILREGEPSWRAKRAASRFVTSLPERVAYAAYDMKTERALQRRWKEVLREAAR